MSYGAVTTIAKRRLMMIKPIKEPEPEDVDLESEEEDTEEESESKPALSTIHALAGYVNPFGVKVADGRILNCNRKCLLVKLVLQGQEIIADFFLLPLDYYIVVLGIEWLSTLGDVS
ncbi:hypothetical protein BHM03_00023873 [Ensete ventricosum]|nr:hypothetical protein BHM03_00023873 [Ensete ventricosum]